MEQALGLRKCGAEIQNWIRWSAQYVMAKIKTFDLWEIALFQACLISFGACLGTVFSKTMKRFRYLFFIAFLGTGIYFIWRMFCCTEE